MPPLTHYPDGISRAEAVKRLLALYEMQTASTLRQKAIAAWRALRCQFRRLWART